MANNDYKKAGHEVCMLAVFGLDVASVFKELNLKVIS